MRYRFIDRLLAVDAHGVGTIRASKLFPRSEDYYDGTFRAEGEVPSSLLLEAMATTGSLLLAIRDRWETHGVLLKVNQAAFARRVLAGDRVIVEGAVGAIQSRAGGEDGANFAVAQVLLHCHVEETAVAEADLLFLCVPMAWSFGARHVQVVTELLELIGLADARP